jgi:Restriction endonuclease XhoI
MESTWRSANLPDSIPEDPTRAAVSLFWTKRADQLAALADGGLAGGAARAAGHMNGIRDLVRSIFIDAGMPSDSIVYEPYLPGFYRARKRWGMAVRYKGSLVGALEFKSQVGSVGKNINNRFEEALGTGTDTWAAQKKFDAYGEVPPWLGYVFVLREDRETEQPNRSINALFPADLTFQGMSYNQRYQEMLRGSWATTSTRLGGSSPRRLTTKAACRTPSHWLWHPARLSGLLLRGA